MTQSKPLVRGVLGLAVLLGGACSSTNSPAGGQGGRGGATAGASAPAEVTVAIPAEQRGALDALKADLASGRPTDSDSFAARWKPRYLSTLPYDPGQAVNLPLVQASTLQLTPAELAVLSKQGFTLSARQQFASFVQGYIAIYTSHLPLFVSADSVLHAVHRSYDKILMAVETAVLIDSLDNLLARMQEDLQNAKDRGWPAETVVDVDEYLAVARGLMGASASPVAGGSAASINTAIATATNAAGLSSLRLFGEDRDIDFSQFTLRGHYDTQGLMPRLEKYFRATMWLGRTDLPLITHKVKQILFHRRAFAGAMLLSDLTASRPASAAWTTLDQTLRAFVGESDNMAPPDVAALNARLGAAETVELLAHSDTELAQAIVDGGFGLQRIASQLLWVTSENEGQPLDRTFLLLGQRFVIDSQVFSNVVYDRVSGTPGNERLMPSPLDIAFAALGNSRAVDLLREDLTSHLNYPAALHDVRRLVDAHEPAFWQGALYNGWLNALRALSPPADTTSPATTKLPAVASTEAWARRLLQTQLASWAELRHDTLLYAKQSYTGIPACEFPDAYVEPMPAVWEALAAFGNRGAALAQSLGLAEKGLPTVGTYFASLAAVASMLKDMADRQIMGQPFTGDQLAFINQAVELKDVSIGSGHGQKPIGWYPQLFFAPDNAHERDTIVADVHTQPGDQGGGIVGNVLHVGTGFPRLMVTTFETCSGPRAYAGVVSNYFEQVTTHFDRLTDQRWSAALDSTSPPAPIGWMSDLTPK